MNAIVENLIETGVEIDRAIADILAAHGPARDGMPLADAYNALLSARARVRVSAGLDDGPAWPELPDIDVEETPRRYSDADAGDSW